MKTFDLPDLGEGLTEAEIVAWHVAAGDHVVADQPLVSVETAKAVVEIPSPQSGRIDALYGEVGDIIGIGRPLVQFDTDGTENTETVVGELPHDVEEPPTRAAWSMTRRPAPRASPAVRSLARELGIDLQTVSGSGPGGVVTADDVRAQIKTSSVFAGGESLRGPRRTMAQIMARAGRETVPATVTDFAVIDTWGNDQDPTVRLIVAIVAGVEAEPRANAWFDGLENRLLVHSTVDLGIAVDTKDGLFVPVLRDAGSQTPEALRDRLEDLKRAVKVRSVAPDELTGQTMTLSNFGMMAGVHASLVVAPPQVAILGAGKIEDRAIARDRKLIVARTLPLSLSFDHRALTGGDATRFLAAAIGSLEAPA